MKKTSLFLVMMLLLTLTACTTPLKVTQETMIIKQSKFSEETRSVLELLDEEIMFFDFVIDETVKSSTINVWAYENGEWIDKGAVSGNIDKAENQIAIQVTENGYNIFTLDESGHIKYSAPEMDIGFENTTYQISNIVTTPTEVVLDTEIPLWVKIGNNGNGISIPTDFRNSNCTAGLAVTITFSDKELE